LAGFVVNRLVHEYGIDLEITTLNRRGEVEPGQIRVQVKATDRLKRVTDGKQVVFRVKRADLLYWLNEPMPVILVVYDGKKDVAYWLYVQAYFANQPGFNLFAAGRELTIRIPTEQVVDMSAMRSFARFRDGVAMEMNKVPHAQD